MTYIGQSTFTCDTGDEVNYGNMPECIFYRNVPDPHNPVCLIVLCVS